MIVERSWLLNEEQRSDQMTSRLIEEQRWISNLKQSGVLVPDTRLQIIADAWNSDSFMPHRSWIRGKFPQLSAAIDNALTEEEK